jgi:hypothetical protein
MDQGDRTGDDSFARVSATARLAKIHFQPVNQKDQPGDAELDR